MPPCALSWSGPEPRVDSCLRIGLIPGFTLSARIATLGLPETVVRTVIFLNKCVILAGKPEESPSKSDKKAKSVRKCGFSVFFSLLHRFITFITFAGFRPARAGVLTRFVCPATVFPSDSTCPAGREVSQKWYSWLFAGGPCAKWRRVTKR